MKSIVQREIDFACLLRKHAPRDNEKLWIATMDMANWWEKRAELSKEFERLISINSFVFFVGLPYWIYAWSDYYKRSRKLEKAFSNIVERQLYLVPRYITVPKK